MARYGPAVFLALRSASYKCAAVAVGATNACYTRPGTVTASDRGWGGGEKGSANDRNRRGDNAETAAVYARRPPIGRRHLKDARAASVRFGRTREVFG